MYHVFTYETDIFHITHCTSEMYDKFVCYSGLDGSGTRGERRIKEGFREPILSEGRSTATASSVFDTGEDRWAGLAIDAGLDCARPVRRRKRQPSGRDRRTIAKKTQSLL